MNVKCPSCCRQFARRVAAVGTTDRLLGIFSLHPFKCQLCGFRFRMPQWSAGGERAARDRRDYERIAVNFPLSFEAAELSGHGIATDLSIAGCSFRASIPLATGALLRLELRPTNDVRAIVVDAAAVRYAHEGSVGVEFLRWQENERDRLAPFVRGLLIGRAA